MHIPNEPMYDDYFRKSANKVFLEMEDETKWWQCDLYKRARFEKEAYEDERARRKAAGESLEGLKPVEGEFPLLPPECEGVDVMRIFDDKFKMHKDEQTFFNIFGEKYNRALVETVGDYRFERTHRKAISELEVVKKQSSEEAKRKKEVSKICQKAREKKMEGFVAAMPGEEAPAKRLTVNEKIKALDLDQWIMMSNTLFRSIMPMVTAIDLDIRKIAFNSGKYAKQGCSTLMQLQTIIELKEQKEMLLNLYVLNKMFAGLVRTPLERQVFLCVVIKEKPTNTVAGQKLRTLYRMRRDLAKRFREFCVRRGFDAEWFYDHFASLPAVRYGVEAFDFDRKISEIKMHEYENQYAGEDVLNYLDGNNIAGV